MPLKRSTPTKTPEAGEAAPSPEKYPFTDLLNALENENPATTGAPPAPAPGHLPQTDRAVPKDFEPAKDVPLSDRAKQALEVSQALMTAGQAPVEGPNGRILYTYGAGLPTWNYKPANGSSASPISAIRSAGSSRPPPPAGMSSPCP